jgi:hypothetical protein
MLKVSRAEQSVIEFLFKDIPDVAMSIVEGKQVELAMQHKSGIFKIYRRKLPRSSDFEQVRGAITLAFEHQQM